MKLTTKKFLLLSMLGLAASACGGDGSDEVATLKIVHNSPDAPNVDVLLDRSVALSNVAYGDVSGDLEVDAGARDVAVNVAGTNQTAIEATLELEKDKKYFVFASDLVSKIKPIILISDDTTPNAGSAQVRVLHGAPSAPNVDVYVTAPDADIATSTPVLSNVAFSQSSDFLTIPAGAYRARVTIAGTKTVAIDSGSLQLEGSKKYTVYAKDVKGGGAPFSLGIIAE